MNPYCLDSPGPVTVSFEINVLKKRAWKFCACVLIDTTSNTEVRGKAVALKLL